MVIYYHFLFFGMEQLGTKGVEQYNTNWYARWADAGFAWACLVKMVIEAFAGASHAIAVGSSRSTSQHLCWELEVGTHLTREGVSVSVRRVVHQGFRKNTIHQRIVSLSSRLDNQPARTLVLRSVEGVRLNNFDYIRTFYIMWLGGGILQRIWSVYVSNPTQWIICY